MKVCHFREDFRQKNWRQKNGKSFTCLDQKLDCDLELIFSPFFCLQFFCLESFLLALSVWFRLRRPEDSRALPPPRAGCNNENCRDFVQQNSACQQARFCVYWLGCLRFLAKTNQAAPLE